MDRPARPRTSRTSKATPRHIACDTWAGGFTTSTWRTYHATARTHTTRTWSAVATCATGSQALEPGPALWTRRQADRQSQSHRRPATKNSRRRKHKQFRHRFLRVRRTTTPVTATSGRHDQPNAACRMARAASAGASWPKMALPATSVSAPASTITGAVSTSIPPSTSSR